MKKNEIIEKVKALGLPGGEYVVFGSCPLAIAGIREAGDIDMLVSDSLWEQLKREGWQIVDKGPDDKPLAHDVFEVHNSWNFSSYQPTLKELLTSADVYDDIPFASLEEVRKWKTASGREKDLKDIKLIDAYYKARLPNYRNDPHEGLSDEAAEKTVGKVVADISMSVDGLIAGPNPTSQEPLGEGGEQLHEWVVKLASWRERHGLSEGVTNADSEVMEEHWANAGAVVMGRHMFSGGEGPWDNDPQRDGWWGDNPPFHVPVFVLTRHARQKVTKQAGTSFTFVTDGPESALKQAKAAAGDKDVLVAGGASAIQQFMAAGLLDEIQIHLVPVFLHSGVRLFENVDPKTKLEKTRVVDSPEVTHLTFRIKK